LLSRWTYDGENLIYLFFIAHIKIPYIVLTQSPKMTEVKDERCTWEEAVKEIRKLPIESAVDKQLVVKKCQQLIPNIYPVMSKHTLNDFIFETRLYDFKDRAILFDTYYRLETTGSVPFTEFLGALYRLNADSDPGARRDIIIALKDKVIVPSWQDLFTIFKTDCLYELEIFLAYISIIDLETYPTHDYILKILKKYYHNKQKHDIIAELIKYKAFPVIDNIAVYRLYMGALNNVSTDIDGKLAESDRKYKNEIIILLSDMLKSEEKEQKLWVCAYKMIFAGKVYNYTIDWNTGALTGIPDHLGLLERHHIFNPVVGIQFI
jgi:hypothetical protein